MRKYSCPGSICSRNTTAKVGSRPIPPSSRKSRKPSSRRSRSSASRSRPATSPGPDHHPLRSLSREGRARGQDRQPGARHRPRHPRRAHQHPRAHSRQGHRRHRDRQQPQSQRSPCANCCEREDWNATKAQDPDRARQGRLRQDDHRRSRRDAARPRRRHHRLGQERLHQRASSPACSTASRRRICASS